MVNTLKARDEIEIVATANDGEEALGYINKYKSDIVVTDVEMPKMTGEELIEIAKDYEDAPQFIVITGGTSVETMQKLYKLPIKRFFQKPLNFENLIEEIILEEETFIEQHSINRTEQNKSNGILSKFKKLFSK